MRNPRVASIHHAWLVLFAARSNVASGSHGVQILGSVLCMRDMLRVVSRVKRQQLRRQNLLR